MFSTLFGTSTDDATATAVPAVTQPTNDDPNSLTAGMPDPATVQRQKQLYMQMLDDQVKQGTAVLDAQVKHQKEYLRAQAEQQKKQFCLQIDMEVQQQKMALEQQKTEQMLALQVQASNQKVALEKQAMELAMDYMGKTAEEQMARKQYDMEVAQQEQQMKLQIEMSQFGANGDLFKTQPVGRQ